MNTVYKSISLVHAVCRAQKYNTQWHINRPVFLQIYATVTCHVSKCGWCPPAPYLCVMHSIRSSHKFGQQTLGARLRDCQDYRHDVSRSLPSPECWPAKRILWQKNCLSTKLGGTFMLICSWRAALPVVYLPCLSINLVSH